MSVYPNPTEVRAELLPQLRIKPWTPLHAPGTTYLTNCSVVDPASGKLLKGYQTVKIVNNLIDSIGPSGKLNIESDARSIDLEGKYLCPGLVDCHVHCTAVPGTTTIGEMVNTPEDLITLRSTFVLKGMLERGFTSVRDTGGATKNLANAIAEGLIPGPRLFQCGKALSQTGGHGDFSAGVSGGGGAGCCGGHSKSLARTADGVPACLKAAREELKEGADFLKIMCGGGVASETDAIETIQYSSEEIKAITSTAWQMGKKIVTAHAYTVEAIEHAVSNGVKAIEHGNLLDKKTAQMMAKQGVFLTPTLSCYGIMVRKPFENFLPPSGQEKNAQVMEKGLEALKIAEEAGVTVCYGTDLLISMHALQTEEFTVRSKALKPDVILRQATTNAAKLLNMVGKLGTIASGAYADLIVLEKNPLEDITVLDRPEHNLVAVIQGGRLVSGRLPEWH